MEALSTHTHQSVKSLQRTLQADKAAYTESVGKREKAHMTGILNHPSGEGTVVRVFFGATTQMPVRGLGYVTAASRIAEHIPHSQLQVIFVNGLGHEINGIDRGRSRRQAELLADLGRKYLQVHKPAMADRVLFGEDNTTELITDLQPVVGEVIAADSRLTEQLAGKGSKHGGDYLAYSAAHIAYQEMGVMDPSPLTCDDPSPAAADRILNVGCQQEHPFYAVRMAARQAINGSDLVPSGQVFTRHVLPPYYMSRSGEQLLEDALVDGIQLGVASDLSVRRDTDYLLQVMPGEEICRAI
ncbi:MAG: hypothetical protein AAB971_02535 [Patescibacteria group bacterium]